MCRKTKYQLPYHGTISSVPSLEPSLTTTHFSGFTLCATIELIVSATDSPSLRTGVIGTYLENVVAPQLAEFG